MNKNKSGALPLGKGKKIADIFILALIFAVMSLYVLCIIELFVWGFSTSLKTNLGFRADSIGFPKGSPFKWEWKNYYEAFRLVSVPILKDRRNAELLELFGNSIAYALGSAFFATLIPCTVAYMTSKFDYKFSKVIYVVVVIAMGLPIVGALPSEIQMASELGLYDHIWGMWILKANFLGMYYLVFFAQFRTIPKDFSEAAEIDGASNLKIYLNIILPIVKNTFFTVMLLKFIEFWNDYQTPMIFMPNHPTAAYGMYYYNFKASSAISWPPMKITGAMLLLLPILVIFLAFHKRLIGNITMGGIKE